MKKRFSTAVFAAIFAFLLAFNPIALAERSVQNVRDYSSVQDFLKHVNSMREKANSDVYFSGLTREEIIDRLRDIPNSTTIIISDPMEMEENITGYSMICGKTGFGIMFKPDVTNDGATIVLFPLEAESISEVDFDDWFNALSFMIQAVDDELTLYEAMQCALFSYENDSYEKNGIRYETSSSLVLSIKNAR